MPDVHTLGRMNKQLQKERISVENEEKKRIKSCRKDNLEDVKDNS